ncbi:MAG: NUDIX hydrolase [Eubacterium sp.]|nr:NUDIX hydrolase [Eubacterium sp.]
MDDYKLIKKYPVHTGNVMDFYECEIGLKDGVTAKWDLVEHSGGAAVLAIDDDGLFIFEKQYRVGADEVLLEIPAGKAEAGEDHFSCIKREMREEIGVVSCDLELMFEFMPSPAYTSEKTSIFLATNLVLDEAKRDEDEYLETVKLSEQDIFEKIEKKEITDGKTIAAFMCYMAKKTDK